MKQQFNTLSRKSRAAVIGTVLSTIALSGCNNGLDHESTTAADSELAAQTLNLQAAAKIVGRQLIATASSTPIKDRTFHQNGNGGMNTYQPNELTERGYLIDPRIAISYKREDSNQAMLSLVSQNIRDDSSYRGQQGDKRIKEVVIDFTIQGAQNALDGQQNNTGYNLQAVRKVLTEPSIELTGVYAVDGGQATFATLDKKTKQYYVEFEKANVFPYESTEIASADQLFSVATNVQVATNNLIDNG